MKSRTDLEVHLKQHIALKENNYCSVNPKKNSKERITVFLYKNVSGIEKLPPVLIGKPALSQERQATTDSYKTNFRRWVSGSIFEE